MSVIKFEPYIKTQVNISKMIENKKPICIHFHIFKNAGTTVDWALEKNFSKNHLSMDEKAKNPSDIFTWKQVLSFLNQHNDVKSFSSHIIRFPLPESKNFFFLPLVFIRHPIDRIFSIYSFNKRREDNLSSIAVQICKTKTINEYIEWALNMPQNIPVKNFQTLYLSRENLDNPQVCIEDYNLALQRLKNCTVIGVVNRLDESLVVAEETLKQYFPGIDLSAKEQNISPERKGRLEDKLKKCKEQLGENLYNKLLAHNEYDLKLFESANVELDIRISKIKNFEKKLKNFHIRKEPINKDGIFKFAKNVVRKYYLGK